MSEQNTPFLADEFRVGEPIRAEALNRLVRQVRIDHDRIQSLQAQRPQAIDRAVFKLTAGPDANDRYTGLRQFITDHNTFVNHPEDEEDYLIYFVGLSEAEEGALPDATTGGAWNAKYVNAVYEGNNADDEQIWHIYDFASASFGLIVDPT